MVSRSTLIRWGELAALAAGALYRVCGFAVAGGDRRIIADTTSTNGADFYSREAADTTLRPQLAVNTAAPPTR